MVGDDRDDAIDDWREHSGFLDSDCHCDLVMATRAINTAQLLTAFETCSRKGYWRQSWQRHRLEPNEMLRQALQAGLTESVRLDFGEVAGERMMGLGADPGMDTPLHNVYDSVVHHAALADVLTTALRRPGSAAWSFPPPQVNRSLQWTSSAFLDPSGSRLRSIVLASNWNEERQAQELRSWHALGECAVYDLPMTIAVLILGRHLGGRRHGAWTKGFLHPQNKQLRFRKRQRVSYETFTDQWVPIWREERSDIKTSKWLEVMLQDGILKEICFTLEVPAPRSVLRKRVLEMAARKLERLSRWQFPPEPSLSVCDRPRCLFKTCCWSEEPFEPSKYHGFVPVSVLDGHLMGT